MRQINKIKDRASMPHPTIGKVREGLSYLPAQKSFLEPSRPKTPPGTAARAGFAAMSRKWSE
jgi:hypothetical protein